MKLNVTLEELTKDKTLCDRTVCVRIPEHDFDRLKEVHTNVSQVVRGLINQFLEKVDEEKRSWIKNK
jgi:hypothetical protein